MGEPIVAWASVLHVVNATEHPVVEVVVAGTDPIETEGAVIFTSTALDADERGVVEQEPGQGCSRAWSRG